MKKKGFTLVELLAVIAILAILVIIALPNVMTMFNSAKKSTFVTEIKKIYRGAEQAYVKDSFDTSGAKYYAKKSNNNCTRELDMSMRDELEYYIEINSQGKVVKFYAHDNSYQFEYEGEMDITDIEDVEDVSGAMEIVDIKCDGADTTYSSELTMFKPGEELNIVMKTLSGQSNPDEDTVNETITAFKRSETLPDVSYESVNDNSNGNETPIYMWYDSGTIYYYSEAKSVALNKDSSNMFRFMTKLSNISGLSDIDASHVKKLRGFFYGCSEVTSLESLRNWNTRRLTDMYTTFAGGSNNSGQVFTNHIASLEPLKNWNTSRVTNMCGTFQLNVALTTLEGLENWNTSNVIDMQALFLGAKGNLMHIKDISALRNWDTSKVTNMLSMFQLNVALESLDGLQNWDTSKVTDMSWMFSAKDGSMTIKSLEPISNWNVSKVTNMEGMFQNNKSLETIAPLKNWNTSSVTITNRMFQNSDNIVTLEGLENWNTSNIEDFAHMFSSCSGLVSANLSNWDMSKAKFYSGRTDSNGELNENGSNIFSNSCTSLTTVITPKAYSNVEGVNIKLPKIFKDELQNTYRTLDSNSPKQTELRAD